MMDMHTKKYYKEEIIMKRWRNNNEINSNGGVNSFRILEIPADA